MQQSNRHNVLRDMGLAPVQFMWVSSDLKMFKYANEFDGFAKGVFGDKFKKVKKQFTPGGQFFAILTDTKPAPGSDSKTTWGVLGVLATFADEDELQEANEMYWKHTSKKVDFVEKMEVAVEVSAKFKEFLESNGRADCFNDNTYLLQQLCVTDIKAARKLSKEFM